MKILELLLLYEKNKKYTCLISLKTENTSYIPTRRCVFLLQNHQSKDSDDYKVVRFISNRIYFNYKKNPILFQKAAGNVIKESHDP